MEAKYKSFPTLEAFDAWHKVEMAARGLPDESRKTYFYVDPLILDSGEVLALIPVENHAAHADLKTTAELVALNKIEAQDRNNPTSVSFWNELATRIDVYKVPTKAVAPIAEVKASVDARVIASPLTRGGN